MVLSLSARGLTHGEITAPATTFPPIESFPITGTADVLGVDVPPGDLVAGAADVDVLIAAAPVLPSLRNRRAAGYFL
jgi:hypothetical protein